MSASYTAILFSTVLLAIALWLLIRSYSYSKALERDLRLAEEKFRKIFRSSPDWVTLSLLEGGIYLDVNDAFCRDTGYCREEIIGRSSLEFGLWPDPAMRKTMVDELRASGSLKDRELELRTKSGEIKTVLRSAELITIDGKSCLISVNKDITDHKLLEAQLRQAQKMEAVGQLAGGIAHDFNNILTTIIGYADLLKGRFREGDAALHHINELLESAERAATLTRSLLAFSRKQVLNITPTDINDIIRKVEHLLSRIIGEDIELNTHYYQDKLFVKADAAQLEQVLMNLATNARDAMPNGGTLTVKTDLQEVNATFIEIHKYGISGSCAVISVADSGTGMDADIREKIFEPFFTTKEVGKGTGLGLAMVYGIVKQHNGYIDVSSHPNSGSVFRIFLPLTDQPLTAASPTLADSDTTGKARTISGKTVLIAEDSDSVRKLSRIVLETAGLKIYEAVDGEDAVAKFFQHQDEIDLVVLDIIMPRKNGRQAYEEIKQIKPGIKVLMTSGYTADVLREKGFDSNMPDMLYKPVSPKALLSKTTDILEIDS
ncbi:MAG TPA: ATP-binding protein [Dissulfurispiraceae bacterium]|nr:ATP-binding protein [Dissulfurispiraceae bacterium]